VPHHKLVDRSEAAEAYLTEARTVANLDHTNIVDTPMASSPSPFRQISPKKIESRTLFLPRKMSKNPMISGVV
jgi:hypothetical protein